MNLYSEEHKSYFVRIADEDFDQDDPVRFAVLRVLDHICNKPIGSIKRLSFGMLSKVAGLSPNEGEVLHRVIAYLIGNRANMLQAKYEFQDGSYFHVLTEEEESEFINEEQFCDPRNGEPIEDCRTRIYIFFQPNFGEVH